MIPLSNFFLLFYGVNFQIFYARVSAVTIESARSRSRGSWGLVMVPTSRRAVGRFIRIFRGAKDVAFIKRNEANRFCLALIPRLFNYHSGHLKYRW